MADNLETMNNFSIQDTMEMGMGNQELLQGLFEPETSTSSPEDVTPIIKDADAPEAPAKPDFPKGKDIIPGKSVDGKTDEEKLEGQSMISDFLGDDDTDEDVPAPIIPEISNVSGEFETSSPFGRRISIVIFWRVERGVG